MSYAFMDHAKWMEDNIAASKRIKMTAQDKKRLAQSRGWYAAPDKLNGFQRRAVTLLGIVGNGIYNAPINWETAYWGHKCLIVSWGRELSTWDFCGLTQAVFLAHDAAIRFSVSAHTFRELQISLHEREPQEGGVPPSCNGHPTLEQAHGRHRLVFGPDHHIHWRPEESA